MWFHIDEHEKALAEQQAMMMQAQQMELMGQPVDKISGNMQKMNIGAERKSPVEAASPLKTETNPQSYLKQLGEKNNG